MSATPAPRARTAAPGCGASTASRSPELSGSHCVRSAATNTFQNNSLPFNKYAYLTTPNSFAIVGEPSHTGVPRITFDNQEDTVSDQLNNGVRALMLDTYDFKGDVWLCHSSGGKCNDFTAFEPALDTFKEIEAFLSANPSEIVTIILKDDVHAPNGLTNVFNALLVEVLVPRFQNATEWSGLAPHQRHGRKQPVSPGVHLEVLGPR